MSVKHQQDSVKSIDKELSICPGTACWIPTIDRMKNVIKPFQLPVLYIVECIC